MALASSLGLEFETDFTMDLFAELTPISILQPPEPEDDIAKCFVSEISLITTQPEDASKIETVNMIESPLTLNLMTALSLAPDLCPSETELDTSALLSFNIEDTDDLNTLPIKSEDIEYGLVDPEGSEMQVLIAAEETSFNMRLMVIVSMIAPFGDGADTLIHAGDFIMEVPPTSTIREIKYGITNTLDICYEDMALVFVGKFLSDSRTIAYYLIDDGQTLHLLVESPNKLFKDVFEAFKRLSLSEERAWFATRSFIHIMHSKYSVDGFGNNETPTLTEELLLHELEQLYVPDTDDSDDSSADEDEPDINDTNVIIVGGMELEFVFDEESDDLDENHNSDDELNSEDEDQISEEQDKSSEDEDNEDGDELSDINENGGDDSDYFMLQTQAIAHYTPVELLE